MWDNTLTPSPPGGHGRNSSWASTLLGVGGAPPPGAPPPAVDSTTDFPELSAAAATEGPARATPAPNGTTMAEQLARAASGPGTPLTAASRLKARKEESVKKMQPISPAAKGPRTGSRLGASASSLSELEGSRPGSGQHDGYDGDGVGANGQLEDAQHLAASMTWQVIDGDGGDMGTPPPQQQHMAGGKAVKRVCGGGHTFLVYNTIEPYGITTSSHHIAPPTQPPPPGFEHVGKGAGVTSHPLTAEGTMSAGDMKHVTSILLQFSLEAILAAAEVGGYGDGGYGAPRNVFHTNISKHTARCPCRHMDVWQRNPALALHVATAPLQCTAPQHTGWRNSSNSSRLGRWVCSCCGSCRARGWRERLVGACMRGRHLCRQTLQHSQPIGNDEMMVMMTFDECVHTLFWSVCKARTPQMHSQGGISIIPRVVRKILHLHRSIVLDDHLLLPLSKQ